MIKLFNAYRILALTVGVMLLLASLNWVGHNLISESIGNWWWLWMIHGYFYMIYLVVAVPFIRKARWPLEFIALMIVAGLIPGLMFWVENWVAKRFKREHPELFPVAAA